MNVLPMQTRNQSRQDKGGENDSECGPLADIETSATHTPKQQSSSLSSSSPSSKKGCCRGCGTQMVKHKKKRTGNNSSGKRVLQETCPNESCELCPNYNGKERSKSFSTSSKKEKSVEQELFGNLKDHFASLTEHTFVHDQQLESQTNRGIAGIPAEVQRLLKQVLSSRRDMKHQVKKLQGSLDDSYAQLHRLWKERPDESSRAQSEPEFMSYLSDLHYDMLQIAKSVKQRVKETYCPSCRRKRDGKATDDASSHNNNNHNDSSTNLLHNSITIVPQPDNNSAGQELQRLTRKSNMEKQLLIDRISELEAEVERMATLVIDPMFSSASISSSSKAKRANAARREQEYLTGRISGLETALQQAMASSSSLDIAEVLDSSNDLKNDAGRVLQTSPHNNGTPPPLVPTTLTSNESAAAANQEKHALTGRISQLETALERALASSPLPPAPEKVSSYGAVGDHGEKDSPGHNSALERYVPPTSPIKTENETEATSVGANGEKRKLKDTTAHLETTLDRSMASLSANESPKKSPKRTRESKLSSSFSSSRRAGVEKHSLTGRMAQSETTLESSIASLTEDSPLTSPTAKSKSFSYTNLAVGDRDNQASPVRLSELDMSVFEDGSMASLSEIPAMSPVIVKPKTFSKSASRGIEKQALTARLSDLENALERSLTSLDPENSSPSLLDVDYDEQEDPENLHGDLEGDGQECPVHVGMHSTPCRRCQKGDYLSEADGFSWIIETMQRLPNHTQVQVQACRSLGVLAWDDKSRSEIAAQEGVQAIVAAMQAHDDDRDVQKNGCGVLANLSANEANRKIIAEQDGIEAIVRAMYYNKKDRDVQYYGCPALGNLARSKENKKVIAEKGGIDVIVTAMQTHKNDKDIQSNACQSLANLSFNDENKKLIAEKHGIVAVLKAMETHPTNFNLQHKGCWVLANLSKKGGSIKRKIQRRGGIDAVVNAMKAHPNNRDVQDIGCQTLANLAAGTAEMEKEIASKGGIHAIVNAMHVHADERGLQEEGCKALTIFTLGSKQELAETDARKVVRDAKAKFDMDAAKKFLKHLKKENSAKSEVKTAAPKAQE